MDETELIGELSSNSLKTVLNAVIALNDIVSSGANHRELVDVTFQSILPLLSHTHYKIRSYAFLILLTLFKRHLDLIQKGLLALPHILLSLLSVNPQIKSSAYDCLRVVFERYRTDDFWFDDVVLLWSFFCTKYTFFLQLLILRTCKNY